MFLYCLGLVLWLVGLIFRVAIVAMAFDNLSWKTLWDETRYIEWTAVSVLGVVLVLLSYV